MDGGVLPSRHYRWRRPAPANLLIMINELATNTTFADLGISPELVSILTAAGFESPFPIQAATIPDGLAGVDVLGKAKTGSGKTLAFGLPIVEGLERAEPFHPRALVLVPTRELAMQVTRDLQPLVEARGFRLVTVYGGASMKDQIDALDAGVELLIATPGRLIDLMERRRARLDDISVVCLDEADQMADMGFMPQVRRIMSAVPDDHQTYLYSATLDSQVQELVDRYMTDPISRASVSLLSCLEVVPDPTREWNPEAAPQATTMNTNGNMDGAPAGFGSSAGAANSGRRTKKPR